MVKLCATLSSGLYLDDWFPYIQYNVSTCGCLAHEVGDLLTLSKREQIKNVVTHHANKGRM